MNNKLSRSKCEGIKKEMMCFFAWNCHRYDIKDKEDTYILEDIGEPPFNTSERKCEHYVPMMGEVK